MAHIPLFKVFLPPESVLMPRLRDVLYSGKISEGEPVYAFEKRFAKYVEAPHSLSFYSGTAALHAAVLLAGVKPGDEVISTPMTAEPTNTAIAQTGARIVWADIDPRSGNITAKTVAAVVSDRTRAVVGVHYGGIPLELDSLHQLLKPRKIPLIEDAAHALGGRYGGQPIGSHSEFVMFSLQAIKHMTTVDGGMLSVRDEEMARRVRLLRWFGIDRQAPRTEVDVATLGFKYHMNNVTATLGLVQLDYVRDVVGRYIANGQAYDRDLQGIKGLTLLSWDPRGEPSYWFYTVLAERRDALSRKLTERGIENGLVHKRNDGHSLFASSRRELPGLDAFWKSMLHIPCGFWVDDEARDTIVRTIREGW